ncbi:MAG: type II toxin-antitoxin system RelB/DinJ family antitoxin [bacterium]|nr:type II toxin-antitoxin system RelB/DinJ family antitoxin [bacterium]
MAQTNVNIRMDDNLKQQFEHLCGELGMNMSTAFNIFAKAMVRKQGIPFEVALDPFYSESNMAHLRRGIKALNSGKGVEHDIIEVEDE